MVGVSFAEPAGCPLNLRPSSLITQGEEHPELVEVALRTGCRRSRLRPAWLFLFGVVADL